MKSIFGFNFRLNLLKTALNCAAFTIVLSVSALSFAQTSDDTESDFESSNQEQNDKSAQEQNNKSSTAQSNSEPAPEFIPSEEISEDLSVSFPTDI
ncbi:hypothetical protein MAH1_11640 [Sessilibacter sp. MAH1]